MQTAIILIISLINIALWIYFFIMLKKKFSSGYLDDMRKEVDILVGELDRAADRDISILEDRLEQVKSLLAEVDRRLIIEKDLQIKRERDSVEPKKKLAKVVDAIEPTLFDTAEKTVFAGILPKNPYGMNNAEPKPEPPPKTEAASELTAETAPEFEQKSPLSQAERKAKILDMAGNGLTADFIAEQLHLSLTEVNLIIEMYGKG